MNNNNRLTNLNPYDHLASSLNLNSLDPNSALLSSLSQTNQPTAQNNANLNMSHLQLPVQLGDPNGNGIFLKNVSSVEFHEIN